MPLPRSGCCDLAPPSAPSAPAGDQSSPPAARQLATAIHESFTASSMTHVRLTQLEQPTIFFLLFSLSNGPEFHSQCCCCCIPGLGSAFRFLSRRSGSILTFPKDPEQAVLASSTAPQVVYSEWVYGLCLSSLSHSLV